MIAHTKGILFFVFWLKSSIVYCRMLGKCDLNRMHPIVRCTWRAGQNMMYTADCTWEEGREGLMIPSHPAKATT